MVQALNIEIPPTILGLGTSSEVGTEARKLGAQNALIVTDRNLIKAGVVQPIIASLEDAGLSNHVLDGCVPEPTIGIIENFTKFMVEGNYDLLIGVGGGSNMDITKMMSILAQSGLQLREIIGKFGMQIEGKILPKILIPTTAGTGAEWSQVAVIYEDNHDDEYTILTSGLLPDKVIIDPELTRNLPAGITADSGFDALSHAIEGFTSRGANAFSDMMAEKAIALIHQNLRKAYENGQDMEARYNLSLAAALAMSAMATGGLGICHPLNEIIQLKTRVVHGKALAVILPSVMEFNMAVIPERFARLAELMGEDISELSVEEAAKRSVIAVRKLIEDLELPGKMRDIGITENDISELAKTAFQTRQMAFGGNPRDVMETDLKNIYNAAF